MIEPNVLSDSEHQLSYFFFNLEVSYFFNPSAENLNFARESVIRGTESRVIHIKKISVRSNGYVSNYKVVWGESAVCG